MTTKLHAPLLLLLTIFLGQCSEKDAPTPNTGGGNLNTNPAPEWLIPQGSVFDGGPGKDGIPAISNPQFITADEATYLNNDDLILGIKIGDDIRAYPHPILDWHEIINDEIGGKQIAITYCPLTGTGVGWDRNLGGNTTTFGVSGLLYNTNLIPYDRRTDSNWSQMLLQCVNGELAGTRIITQQLIETTWGTWKAMFPDTKVVSTATGYNRTYGRYPYGDYRTNNSTLIFPVAVEDNRLPWKERVLGIVSTEGEAQVYRFGDQPAEDIRVINDGFGGGSIAVVSSRTHNFMVAFERKLEDGTALTLAPVNDALPIVMTDQEGNQWNIFGEAISGPRTGTKLKYPDSFIGYWVAWGAFYPGLKLR